MSTWRALRQKRGEKRPTSTITLIEKEQEGKSHLPKSLHSQSQNVYARKTLFGFQCPTLTGDENTLSTKSKW